MNALNDHVELRVLSIQSHVVHGYVGNKSAVFPLQVAGFEVDIVNSVQFSNHTDYQRWKGQILDSEQLWDLYEGLCLNSITDYSHVLTGYTASPSFLTQLARIIGDLKKKNPRLYYIRSEGAHGYISGFNHSISRRDYAKSIRARLTGVSISNETDIFTAIKVMHDRGVPTIVVSSTDFQSDENSLVGYGSQKNPGGSVGVYKFVTQRINAHFNGTGDLFTSLLLIWLQKTDYCLKDALEKAVSALQDVLKKTISYAQKKNSSGPWTSKELELKLIQSKDDLLTPKSSVQVIQLR